MPQNLKNYLHKEKFLLGLIAALCMGIAGFSILRFASAEVLPPLQKEKASLVLINPISHPRTGEIWDIRFLTQGGSDLLVTLNDIPTREDLEFLGLYCDEILVPSPISLPNKALFTQNYGCEATSSLRFLVRTAGNHSVTLQFGVTQENAHNADMFQWSKRLGGADDEYPNQSPYAVATDTSGNILVTWQGDGAIDLNGDGDITDEYESAGLGNKDALVSVFNKYGNFKWAKRLGGIGNDCGVSITSDSSDRVIVTGKVTGAADLNGDGDTLDDNESVGYGDLDIFISVFDSSGSFIWSKRLGGSSYEAYSQGITTDGNDRIIVIGSTLGDADLNGDGDTDDEYEEATVEFNDLDIFFSVFTSSGEFEFSKRLGGRGFDIGSDVKTDLHNRIIVTGRIAGNVDLNGDGDKNDPYENTSYGQDDAFISVFNALGAFQWAKRMGGTNKDSGYSLAIDSHNRILATGHIIGAGDLNGDGDMLDENETSGYGDYDGFLSVFDEAGTFQFSKRIGGSGEDVAYKVVTDTSDRVIVYGYVYEIADLNSDGDKDDMREAVSYGGFDIFWSIFDATGTFQTCERLGGANDDYGYSIATDAASNFVVLGIVDGAADLNGDGDTTDANESIGYGGYDVFISYFVSDLVPPAKSNFSPASGSTIYSSHLTITFDLDQEGDCRASPFDESYDDMNDNTDCSGDGTTSISCLLADLGDYGEKQIYISCQDLYGNKDSSSTNTALMYIYAREDTTAPALTISPFFPDPTNDATPAIHGSATDELHTVSAVQFQIDSTSGPWTDCIADDTLFDEATETFTCLVTNPLTDGPHTIYFRATDSDGNTTPEGSYSFDSFTVDTIPPAISITHIDHFLVTPTSWLTNRKPLFEGSTEPNTDIHVEVPSAGISTWIISDANGHWYWQSGTNLPLGIHSVTITAWDRAANSGATGVTLVVIASFSETQNSEIPEEKDLGEKDEGKKDEGKKDDNEPEEKENEQEPPSSDREEPSTPQGGFVDLLPFLVEVGTSVSEVLESVTSSIRKLNTATSTKVASITLITVTAFTGGAEVAASTGTSIFNLPLLLSNTFIGGLFGLGRKRKPWGVVYDSITKEPLSRVVVRVFQKDTLVQTSVTDMNGVFTVNLMPGMYTIQVQKGSYIFPSSLVTGTSDGKRTPIYRGGEVKAPEQDYTFSMYIPLDPEGAKTGKKILTQARSVGSILLSSAILAVLIFGTIFSIWSFFATHLLFYLFLSILNLFALMFNMYVRNEIPGGWGTVVNEDGKAISNLEIGLYDAEYGKLIDNRVTDTNGKYRFIVQGGRYILRPVGMKYASSLNDVENGILINSGEKTDTIIVKEKLVVRKNEPIQPE